MNSHRSLAFSIVGAAFLVAQTAVAQTQIVDLSVNGAAGAVVRWAGPQANAAAGATLARGELSGDVNRRDMIVGAPRSGPVGQGQVFAVFSGPSRAGTVSLSSANVIVTGESAGDGFGTAITTGWLFRSSQPTAPPPPRDLIVGAPTAAGGNGIVYVFPGPFTSQDFRSATSAFFKVVGNPGERLGANVGTADLDGDGFRDLVMYAAGSGRIYVIFGGPSLSGVWDLAARPANVTITGIEGSPAFASGDLNDDGFSDMAMSSPATGNGSGAVYVVTGRPRAQFNSTLMLPAEANVIFSGIDAGDHAGAAIAVTDFDGDGIADLVVAAPDADGPENARPSAGEAYVVYGRKSFSSRSLQSADVTLFGGAGGYHFGTAIANGHLRRDLPNDLVFLSPGANLPAGELHVFYGRPKSQLPSFVDLAAGPDRVLRGDVSAGPIRTVVSVEVIGGAEDVVAGVPAASNGTAGGAGLTFVAYSPKLVPSTSLITVSAAQGGNTSVTFNVTNVGTLNVPFAARSNTPWLFVTPSSSTTAAGAPGQLTVTVRPANLATGTYQGGLSIVTRSADVLNSLNLGVNLTVTPGTPTAPVSTNPFGLPDPPDEGSPEGVFTPVGSNVAVIPVRDVLVRFTSVTAAGRTRVDITSSLQANGRGVFWGPWFYRISTDAVVSGPVTIGLAYDAALVTPSTGQLRIWKAGGALITQRVEPTNRYVLATASGLPVNVTVQNNFHTDFSDDGFADLLWQRRTDGGLSLWSTQDGPVINGATAASIPGVADPRWKVVGSADFDRDGYPDLLWRHDTLGTFGVWLMQGSTIKARAMLNPSGFADTAWKVVAIIDFDGDGFPDLLWRHDTLGTFGVWFMNGTDLRSRAMLNPTGITDTTWKVAGVGDFDGDGHPDLLWRNDISGAIGAWFMNGTNLRSAQMLNPSAVSDINWKVEGVADIDGDGRADIIWHNTFTGAVGVWLMNGINLKAGASAGSIGGSWKLVGVR